MNIPFDVSGIEIRTPRLLLRPWQSRDLDDLYAYASVEGVGEMAGWIHHDSPAESQKILEMFIRGKKTFALEYEGRVIGSLGIECYDEAQLPELNDLKGREIGYVLARDYWGQGLMPEAVNAVIDWIFENTEMDVLTCGHFLHNQQSRRVQEKCGFHFLKQIEFETMYGTTEISRLSVIYRRDWLAGKQGS